jgi:uncharacterized C2H2 Zn-finger protein
MAAAMECPRCGSSGVKMPPLGVAPKGYVFDGSLILLTCPECRVVRPMPEFIRDA